MVGIAYSLRSRPILCATAVSALGLSAVSAEVRADGRVQRGLDIAGTQGVDADAVPAELDSHGLGQEQHAPLGRVVVGVVRLAAQAGISLSFLTTNGRLLARVTGFTPGTGRSPTTSTG